MNSTKKSYRSFTVFSSTCFCYFAVLLLATVIKTQLSMAPTLMDRDRLLSKLENHLRFSGRKMNSFHFLYQYLSPIRDQRNGGQCAFVASITCVEMIHRILGITIDGWSERYYFNVDDAFNNLYELYPNIGGAQKKKADKTGLAYGTKIKHILEFIRKYGLMVSSECYDPRLRDFLSKFDKKVDRHKIAAYKQLQVVEDVERYVQRLPVIAVILSCDSFKHCRSILYNGPSALEKDFLDKSMRSHSVVIVGTVKIESKTGWDLYFILQESRGESFGFMGFVVAKYDKDMFVEFWLPIKWEKTNVVSVKRKYSDVSKHDKGGPSLHA